MLSGAALITRRGAIRWSVEAQSRHAWRLHSQPCGAVHEVVAPGALSEGAM
jgi:hypothetical protein